MAKLSDMFGLMKNNGLLVPKIDEFLLNIGLDEDRSHDYISPSSIHTCIRAQLYRILGERRENNISARLQRIFDTGTAIHTMLQNYLLKEGTLLIDEAPVYSDRLKVTGHADGILRASKTTLGVLEIKSINSDGFKKLIDAKDEHKLQANVYLVCLEELRKRVASPPTAMRYMKVRKDILQEYKCFMETFVTTGKKHTKEEKIDMKLAVMKSVLDLLRTCKNPITTVFFLYFNKDTQELKEYAVSNDTTSQDFIEEVSAEIREWRDKKELPPRPEEATMKSCTLCRSCDYKNSCFR